MNYTYRLDGLRHSKETGKSKTTHYWDGQNMVLETNNKDFVKAIYVRGSSLIFQMVGESNYHYVHNAHGDSTPTYQYDAFGNQREINFNG